jgi:hypothetical protein
VTQNKGLIRHADYVKQIHALLSAKDHLQFLYLVLAALTLTALELVGIGAIVALTSVLPQPDLFYEIACWVSCILHW